ncbi:MAG TPA: hypothetical protein IAB59_00290 [Candidatus Onthousia faecipullorum]|uniref:DUF4355 domain-containing protein n=1 Tax=Candidatus Onthousia faecipullorum TaxID=2840887 RepID=A0A9D1KAW6_9FIRM|nr:hypothetical protein [Candidatus Onthousia faecipullorum]
MEQENVQNVTEEKVTENTETQTAEEKVEKAFATQEEFNEALKKEVARKTRNVPSKEELKAFNEWKESKKTETEKSLEKDKRIETLEKQLAYAENKSVVANAGVDSKFQKFVLSEVSEIEGDFEDNLKDYLKENPQYLVSKVETPKTNGVATKKISNDAEDGVTAILKAKHPDIDF